MLAQAATCTNHVTKDFNFTGGNRRPRRSTSVVASAHGSHESAVVTNSFTQAWFMPSARMTKTVCIAATNPKPTIHIYRCDCMRM